MGVVSRSSKFRWNIHSTSNSNRSIINVSTISSNKNSNSNSKNNRRPSQRKSRTRLCSTSLFLSFVQVCEYWRLAIECVSLYHWYCHSRWFCFWFSPLPSQNEIQWVQKVWKIVAPIFNRKMFWSKGLKKTIFNLIFEKKTFVVYFLILAASSLANESCNTVDSLSYLSFQAERERGELSEKGRE